MYELKLFALLFSQWKSFQFVLSCTLCNCFNCVDLMPYQVYANKHVFKQAFSVIQHPWPGVLWKKLSWISWNCSFSEACQQYINWTFFEVCQEYKRRPCKMEDGSKWKTFSDACLEYKRRPCETEDGWYQWSH